MIFIYTGELLLSQEPLTSFVLNGWCWSSRKPYISVMTLKSFMNFNKITKITSSLWPILPLPHIPFLLSSLLQLSFKIFHFQILPLFFFFLIINTTKKSNSGPKLLLAHSCAPSRQFVLVFCSNTVVHNFWVVLKNCQFFHPFYHLWVSIKEGSTFVVFAW